jgi:hypothetical protein
MKTLTRLQARPDLVIGVAVLLTGALALCVPALSWYACLPLFVGAAVTANQAIARRGPETSWIPAAASINFYEGTLVYENTAGYATDIINGGANFFVGVAKAQQDNSSGSAGDLNVETWAEGEFIMNYSGTAAQTVVGVKAYGVNNNEVNITSSSQSFVGVITEFISASKVRVRISAWRGAAT